MELEENELSFWGEQAPAASAKYSVRADGGGASSRPRPASATAAMAGGGAAGPSSSRRTDRGGGAVAAAAAAAGARPGSGAIMLSEGADSSIIRSGHSELNTLYATNDQGGLKSRVGKI